MIFQVTSCHTITSTIYDALKRAAVPEASLYTLFVLGKLLQNVEIRLCCLLSAQLYKSTKPSYLYKLCTKI